MKNATNATNKNWKAERKAELRSKFICAGIVTALIILNVVLLSQVFAKTFPDVFAEEVSVESMESYVNMDEVVDFEVNENTLYLHFEDGTGYYWEEETVSDIESTETSETYVNMNNVVSFEANGNALYLHFSDGTGYYLETDDSTLTTCKVIDVINYNNGTSDIIVSMPNGESHIYMYNETISKDTKNICFKVASENKSDYTQYEIVSFE